MKKMLIIAAFAAAALCAKAEKRMFHLRCYDVEMEVVEDSAILSLGYLMEGNYVVKMDSAWAVRLFVATEYFGFWSEEARTWFDEEPYYVATLLGEHLLISKEQFDRRHFDYVLVNEYNGRASIHFAWPL